MPRQKNSALKARVSGADLNHPGRYKTRSSLTVDIIPIGDAPIWLTEAQHAAWDDLCEHLPWLERAHGGIVGIASVLLAKLHANTANMSEMNLLRLCLGQLGATPADAHRVSMPAQPSSNDPAEAYFS